jgi:hypothetical protein
MGKRFGDEALFQAPHPHAISFCFALLFHVATEFIGMLASSLQAQVKALTNWYYIFFS